jgi:carbamoylphosphate synthase large subunit
MRNLVCRTDLPILMLYDVDPEWPQDGIRERLEVAQRLTYALKAVGHPVISAGLETADLTAILHQHNPEEIIVFKWCEDIQGIPHSGALAAQKLERLGFTYTGADFSRLTLSKDKRKIKRRLEKAGIPTPPGRCSHLPTPEPGNDSRQSSNRRLNTAAMESRAKP